MEKLINSLWSSADAEAFREPVDWRGLGLLDYPAIIKRPMDLGTVKLRLERGAYPTAEACAADVRLIWENCRTYNTGGVPVNLHKAADALSKRFEARFAKMRASGRMKPLSKGTGGRGGGKGSARTKGGGGKNSKSGSAAADMATTSAAPTDEDRRKLARHLGRARMEDVTAAVHEIDRGCPEALALRRGRQGYGGGDDDDDSRGDDPGDDQATLAGSAPIDIEIDVDALDPWTFYAVERVVAPLAALRRASRATAMRRTKKKRRAVSGAAATTTATTAAAPVTTAISNSGKGCGKMAGGSRNQHQKQEGGGGTAEADQGVLNGANGEGGGATEGRPCKKAKTWSGGGGASL